MKKKILIAALIVITIGLGFVRDHIFVSINSIIETGNDTTGNLSILKWVLTFVFSILYFINTCAVLFVVFQSKKYFRIALLSYVFLFSVAFLTAATGYFISSFANIYPFIRTIMGVAQSPVVMMVLIPACFFNEKNSGYQVKG